MRMLTPRALGGDRVAIDEALEVYEELARRDGSLAWALMILSGSPIFSDYLSADAASELFAGGHGIIAGNLGPTGRAAPAPGGYRVSGQWPFASGCHNANWFVGGCTVTDGPLQAGQAQERLLVLLPARECRILDTWFTTGLRGSGSHDIEANDVFVPDAHTFPFDLLQTGPRDRPGLGYPYPFQTLGRTVVTAVAFGIAGTPSTHSGSWPLRRCSSEASAASIAATPCMKKWGGPRRCSGPRVLTPTKL
jgi:alkylation response protein AidB-like acyl-CoA dehydrogenase